MRCRAERLRRGGSPGRLTAYYRAAYGVLPSRTLHVQPPARDISRSKVTTGRVSLAG